MVWKNGLQNLNGPAFTGFAFYSLGDQKNRFSTAKKRRENRHFGVRFSKSGMEIIKQKLGSSENPSHAWPSQKGMAIGQNAGQSRGPKLGRKAVSFLQQKKTEFPPEKPGHTSRNREESVFLSLPPSWVSGKKKKKKEKNRVSL